MTKIEEMEYLGEARYQRVADVAVKQQCSVRAVIWQMVDMQVGVEDTPIANEWGEGVNNPEKPVDINH